MSYLKFIGGHLFLVCLCPRMARVLRPLGLWCCLVRGSVALE